MYTKTPFQGDNVSSHYHLSCVLDPKVLKHKCSILKKEFLILSGILLEVHMQFLLLYGKEKDNNSKNPPTTAKNTYMKIFPRIKNPSQGQGILSRGLKQHYCRNLACHTYRINKKKKKKRQFLLVAWEEVVSLQIRQICLCLLKIKARKKKHPKYVLNIIHIPLRKF